MVSCSANHSNNLTSGETAYGEIVFDCFNENHAWGHRLTGFFIDRNGMVYRYKQDGTARQPKPIVQGKQSGYEAAEILNKFTDKKMVTQIESVIMQNKIALIDTAASGSVSYVKERVADAGINVCLAYRYAAEKNRYYPIELGSFGITQITTVNDSSAAKTLLQWLVHDVGSRRRVTTPTP